jgi:iron complex outermembrane recepter protein
MKGVEIAYQQFFDMLPAPFDGIGVQANYSYIEASGVPSYDAGNVAYDVKSLPLQGQSKKTYNFALMYEKYDWSLRLAYNWRSKYLLTTRDVITGLPIYNDDAGFLDGSAFYTINDNFKVGMQFTNLLDTQTKTFMQVDAGGTQLGRSWFVNDRRATFVLRGTF